MSNRKNHFSPLRWVEVVVLRLVYGGVKTLIAVRNGFSVLLRRPLAFASVTLSMIAVVMVAAIPVSSWLLGKNFLAIAGMDDRAAPTGTIAGRDDHNGESPFSSIGSIDSANNSSGGESAVEHAGKHVDPNYVCPMHPEILSKNPGETCPICGMDLVLVEAGGEGGIVTISAETMNALGVRTEPVSRRNIYRRVDTVGYIAENENNMRSVALRTEGWIERLVVKVQGDYVKKGDLLFEVYSPILVNAQEEYVQAIELGNPSLIKASEERLVALGVSRQQIDAIRSSRKASQLVAIYAPQNGYVAELNAREGMQVMPSTPIINLVDLSSVWLLVDVFERQADWVKIGQKAQASLPFMPGKSWKGTVEYVYPSIDAKTRSLKVRLRFDNPDNDLKPNMYADVRILANPKKDVLAIPRESVIRTGTEERVIIAMGEGRFVPMPVRTGVETDDHIEVVSGLNEGDEVVVSSQFMIDSEASQKAAMMKMLQN